MLYYSTKNTAVSVGAGQQEAGGGPGRVHAHGGRGAAAGRLPAGPRRREGVRRPLLRALLHRLGHQVGAARPYNPSEASFLTTMPCMSYAVSTVGYSTCWRAAPDSDVLRVRRRYMSCSRRCSASQDHE